MSLCALNPLRWNLIRHVDSAGRVTTAKKVDEYREKSFLCVWSVQWGPDGEVEAVFGCGAVEIQLCNDFAVD
jgi:hypothetical protein